MHTQQQQIIFTGVAVDAGYGNFIDHLEGIYHWV